MECAILTLLQYPNHPIIHQSNNPSPLKTDISEDAVLIVTKNLCKQYNGITVLNLPDLEIPQGQSFGLVGNNGAGKTTFFSLILDLIRASEGQVLSKGKNVAGSEHWKSYTGSYLDENFLIDFLSPEEYFEFIADLHHLSRSEYDDFIYMMKDFLNNDVLGGKKYIRELSKGNQKKVGIAAALIGKPETLVLDEPFPNLDPTTVIRLKNLLRELSVSRKITMLISSHDLTNVTEVCERIVILENGCIVRDLQTSAGTLKELDSYFKDRLH